MKQKLATALRWRWHRFSTRGSSLSLGLVRDKFLILRRGRVFKGTGLSLYQNKMRSRYKNVYGLLLTLERIVNQMESMSGIIDVKLTDGMIHEIPIIEYLVDNDDYPIEIESLITVIINAIEVMEALIERNTGVVKTYPEYFTRRVSRYIDEVNVLAETLYKATVGL